MIQKLEDALRRLEANAKTLVGKDDVAIVRAAIVESEQHKCPTIQEMFKDAGVEFDEIPGGALSYDRKPKEQIEGD